MMELIFTAIVLKQQHFKYFSQIFQRRTKLLKIIKLLYTRQRIKIKNNIINYVFFFKIIFKKLFAFTLLMFQINSFKYLKSYRKQINYKLLFKSQ